MDIPAGEVTLIVDGDDKLSDIAGLIVVVSTDHLGQGKIVDKLTVWSLS